MDNDSTDELIISKPYTTCSTESSSSQDNSQTTTDSSCHMSAFNKVEGELAGLNTLTNVSDEIYTIMQKQLDITQLDANYSDANPRKDSPSMM